MEYIPTLIFLRTELNRTPGYPRVYKNTQLDTKYAFSRLSVDQGNEVYGGGDESVGIFLHRSSDNAIVRGIGQLQRYKSPFSAPPAMHVSGSLQAVYVSEVVCCLRRSSLFSPLGTKLSP